MPVVFNSFPQKINDTKTTTTKNKDKLLHKWQSRETHEGTLITHVSILHSVNSIIQKSEEKKNNKNVEEFSA